MTRRGLLLSGATLLPGALIAAGLLAAEARKPLSILIVNDLRGWTFPCQCKEGVLGGFPRRATLIEELRPDLLLDAGDRVFQASPYDLVKLDVMHELHGRMGFAAANVGRREAEFSKAEILRAARTSPVPLISANLVNEEGERVLPGHVLVERRGTTFAIVGAVTPRARPGAGLVVADPVEAVRREIAAAKNADFTILLAALNADEIEDVLKKVEGIDILLGGLVPNGSRTLEPLTGVPCFFVVGKGQHVGEILLTKGDGGLRPASGRRIALGPEIESEPAVQARIEDFERSLEHLDLLGRREHDGPYAGSFSCVACHGGIHEEWKGSPHAKALSALTPEKGLFDPQCLSCHATAAGRGGYVSMKETPEFAAIGCESCHGPSRAHADAPLIAERPKTPTSARDACATCHESDHSRPLPEFEEAVPFLHGIRKGER